ncbi:MAG: hypothetical protein ACYDAE_04180, partial [Steroidobacteraceae bacterium]
GGVLELVGDEAGLHLVTLWPPGDDDLVVVERAYRMMPVGPLSRCHASRPERAGLMLGYANISAHEIPAMVRDLIPIVHACMPKRGH